MSGKPINDSQIRIYMSARTQGKQQITAAALAGICERSGRRIEKGEIISGQKRKRHWRTRKDPFAEVWESEIVPMLSAAPDLQPKTLFEYLEKQYPGKYPKSKERTFQRKVKKWKGLYGKGKEVMFLQRQIPGRLGLTDFTTIKKATITINGQPLKHILYHFRLAYSGWCHVKVILSGESFSALSEGLQDALWRLGGVPLEHRTDSLSAAFKNMTKDAKEDVTNRYKELFSHYKIKPTRNNKGQSHENGGIESPHGHLKNRIKQALLLRDSSDFESVDAYQKFLDDIVHSINRNNQDKITEEHKHLQPLPLHKTIDYTEEVVGVSTASTIRIKRALYTVPSRLIGEKLRVHVYHDRLELYLGTSHVFSTKRVYGQDKKRARNVDYRHVIGSLERKPQAFRFSQLRDNFLPSDAYKTIWEWLDDAMEPRAACKTIVGILALANRLDCEERLGRYLLQLKEQDKLPVLHELKQKFDPKEIEIPDVQVQTTAGGDYDLLIPSFSSEGGRFS
ncbi:MAG: IS21 family transposase [Desulfobacteraceae bacterium]|nr:IS21 family transposase [Desulfobacteraceae bacterium]